MNGWTCALEQLDNEAKIHTAIAQTMEGDIAAYVKAQTKAFEASRKQGLNDVKLCKAEMKRNMDNLEKV